MDSLKYFPWGKYVSSMNSSLNILLTFKHTYYFLDQIHSLPLNPSHCLPTTTFLSQFVCLYTHMPHFMCSAPPPRQLNAFSFVCMCLSVRSSTQQKHLRALNLWRKLTASSHQLPIDLPIRVRFQELLPSPLRDFCWGCFKSLHEESVCVG